MEDKKIRDLVIIVAGPAALSAALYTSREDIDTVMIEKGAIGGLAAVTDWIDNYPGFAKGISGLELSDAMRAQAERFGAQIELDEVLSIEDRGETKFVKTHMGGIEARAVLLATGNDYNKIGVPGEQEFYARGVHYCATCDGAFYRDKRLVVVGGGNCAVQEGLFLTRFANHIDILIRSDWKASEVLVEEVEKNDKITVHKGVATKAIVGANNQVTKVIATDASGQSLEFPTDGVFIFAGLYPNTGFLKGSGIELDERGFIRTDERLMTNIGGIFASGDVRSGATLQIASAVGEGATAALNIRRYLEELGKK